MPELLVELSTHYAGAVGRSMLRYGVICGGLFGLFWFLLARPLEHRRIQDRPMLKKEVWGELKDSIFATLVMAAVGAVTLVANDHGMLKVYMDPMEHGLPWLAFTTVLLVFGFDAYFYWTHRLMHHVKLYNLTHEKHHQYVNPTPMASYSFTAWEALVYAVFGPVLMLFLPLNFWVLMTSGVFFAFASAMVHLGYEVAPSWWGRNPVTRWIGTSTMHNMHHEFTHYNFGLYFTYWDRWMGTMHPDYDELLEELTAQPLFQRRRQS